MEDYYAYTCKECGKDVRVTQGGEIVRSCEHNDKAVIANMEAVATGECYMEQG